MRQKAFVLAWFLLHFLLIITVCGRETLWLVAHDLTIFPSSFKGGSEKAGTIVSAVLGQTLANWNPVRRGVATYLHLGGIEKGYGYFAPNVPVAYKLAFELHYPDGRVERELPRVNSAAAGLRVAALLDEIGRTRDDALREYMVKMLARAIWQDHPDAVTIQAVFGLINLPSVGEFEQGKRESYKFLYAYDFTRREKSAEPPNR